jgi:hypothetical protein
LGDPLKENLLLFYKPLHLEAQQVSTRIEVRRHHWGTKKNNIPRQLAITDHTLGWPWTGELADAGWPMFMDMETSLAYSSAAATAALFAASFFSLSALP